MRQRNNPSPLLAVIRNISYAEVATSVLTLQRPMLVSFGGMSREGIHSMNAMTGAAVCVFVLLLGIYMIVRGVKKGELHMARSKLVEANEKIAEKVTSAYKHIENTAVNSYTKIEDAFVDRYLTRDGETVEEAKKRQKNRRFFILKRVNYLTASLRALPGLNAGTLLAGISISAPVCGFVCIH